MKRIAVPAWCAAIALLFAASCPAATDQRPLFPIVRGGMWGYMNRAGKVVIRPRFDGANYFSEGLGRVKIGFGEDAGYGYIDKAGRSVIKPQFSDAAEFSERLAAVRVVKGANERDDRWGYVNKKGKLVIPARYFSPGVFHNGVARVYIKGPGDGRRLALINRTGKTLESVIEYEGSRGFGYVILKGRSAIDRRALRSLHFSEGLAAAPTDEEYPKSGYVDATGKVVIKPRFSSVQPFHEGLAAVRFPIDSGWGYIDKTGKTVIEPQFEHAESFSDGLALVSTSRPGQEIITLDDPDGHDTVSVNKRRYSFINSSGKAVLRLSYDRVESFRDGLARVWKYRPDIGGEPSYIDRTGKLVWKAED
ncbi:MAG: WG repeat-containing protein [Armatimonadota bacterium]|nr:WG repeat-containing protein [Armatimonadota bacterium]